MGTKYLGETFDIHGGGMDLKFPHHECEIAQSIGAYGKPPVNYWLHTNMLTVNGQKMSKSLGNSFLPQQLIKGDHELLDQPYSPMTVRFFMLQSHYSSTLDFSNEALKAAARGYKRLMNGIRVAKKMKFEESEGKMNKELVQEINESVEGCTAAMNDDFNTALTISHIFNLLKKINSLHTGQINFHEIGERNFQKLKSTFIDFTEKVLGLREENPAQPDEVIEALLKVYKQAKFKKEYDKVDMIRADLRQSGIILKDMKTGVEWAYEE
jgi:cysteinyl-tRNA synthetase